jgi:glycosyltransferase involved in cell wall biosynthesis
VVIQAWAHGTPVVAAASVGPAKLVTHLEDGMLAPVEDDAELAAGIFRVIHEPGLGARLAEAGAARLARDFSKAAIVAQWRTLFAELETR